jgi:replicative DNA helicase
MEKVGDKIKNLRRTNSRGEFQQGKLPPQVIDMEEAVLGAVMLESESLDHIAKILTPDCFYKEENQRIFTACLALHDKTSPVDILTVTQQLKKTGELELVGGPYYITRLTNRVSSSSNTEYHAKIVFQKYIQRELIRVAGEIYNEAFEDTTDAFDLLEKADSGFNHITKGIIAGKEVTAVIAHTEDAVVDYKVRKAAKKENKITGTNFGLTALNKKTGGAQKSDLIIIGARPSMGKTAVALCIALNSDEPGLIFSLEMSTKQLVDRMIISTSDISATKFRDGSLDDHDEGRLNTGKKELDGKPIYIHDTAAITIRQIRAKARNAAKEKKIKWIIIDYLQLCHVDSNNNSFKNNREQDLAQISGGLKALAKELDIPVIALSQLSRKCEERPDKRPQLSDLRESGAIEQDADLVLLLFRPEFYGMKNEKKELIKGVGEIIVAKNRNGGLTYREELLFRYTPDLRKIWDYEKGKDGQAPITGAGIIEGTGGPGELFQFGEEAAAGNSTESGEDDIPF